MKSSDNIEDLEAIAEELEGDNDEISLDEESKEDETFYENLAEKLPEATLERLSAYLLEALAQDEDARNEWMEAFKKGKKYLGFSLEDLEDVPFTMANRMFDTTFPTAVIRSYSVIRAELLPDSGPAGYKINGTISPEKEEKATRNREWMNYYLTVEDSPYYADSEKCILNTVLAGSSFKKIYFDKLLDRQVSRFISPEDFLVDGDCSSILESNRLTHILHLSKREIILNQQYGVYRDVELPHLVTSEEPESNDQNKIKKDLDTSVYTKNSIFTIYESHTYLNLNDFAQEGNNDKTDEEVPLPYIVTLDEISKKILSIRRNWNPDDKNKRREEFFVQYNYLPGFGIYGIGMAHLMGSNAISLTKILRQLVDAGSFQNLQGGFRQAGGPKGKNPNLIVGIGEWVELDTAGTPLRDYLLPFPYAGPSNALRELRQEMIAGCKELCSSAEMGMLEGRDGVSTATTLALLEQNNRIQSAVLRSIHASLSRELQLLNKLFKKTLDSRDFNFNGNTHNLTTEDFIDDVTIIPISDPSMGSRVQRLAQAQAIMQTAAQAPEMHNMHEIFKMIYRAQGINDEDIKKILPPEPEEIETQPLDPSSENINMLTGEPVKAAIWQNHPAHILEHGTFAQAHPDNPELQARITAHIQEHQAFEYLIQVQEMIGMQMPSLEELQDPEIQNTIAMAIAQARSAQPEQEREQPPAPIDPSVVVLEEIRARERMAAEKAETDIFGKQLGFEGDKMKIEAERELALMKIEAERELATMKIQAEQERTAAKIEVELTKQEMSNVGL